MLEFIYCNISNNQLLAHPHGNLKIEIQTQNIFETINCIGELRVESWICRCWQVSKLRLRSLATFKVSLSRLSLSTLSLSHNHNPYIDNWQVIH